MKSKYLALIFLLVPMTTSCKVGFFPDPTIKIPTGKSATEFVCRNNVSNWVTIAQQTNRDGRLEVTDPLFNWSTNEFGDDWTPEKRCHEVTLRLNTLARNNGGYLYGLNFQSGLAKAANGQEYPVVCVAKDKLSCTTENMIVTVKRANNPDESLKKIIGFVGGDSSGYTIDENGNGKMAISFWLKNRPFKSVR